MFQEGCGNYREQEMAERAKAKGEPIQAITFTVGDQEYALEITAIQEVERVGSITRLPHVPAYVVGAVNLRGSVVPVIDLRIRLGEEKSPLTRSARIIFVEAKEGNVGLLVDAVYQVVSVPPEKLVKPPPGGIEGAGTVVEKVARVGDRLILFPRLDALVVAVSGRPDRPGKGTGDGGKG